MIAAQMVAMTTAQRGVFCMVFSFQEISATIEAAHCGKKRAMGLSTMPTPIFKIIYITYIVNGAAKNVNGK
jgi:hypothetical protein